MTQIPGLFADSAEEIPREPEARIPAETGFLVGIVSFCYIETKVQITGNVDSAETLAARRLVLQRCAA